MNDVFHNVGIGACRDRREHIAGGQRTPVHIWLEGTCFSSLQHMGYLVERAFQGNVAAAGPTSAMICCAESTAKPGTSASRSTASWCGWSKVASSWSS